MIPSAPEILGLGEVERIYTASGQWGCGRGRVGSGRLRSLEKGSACPHRQ